MLGKMIKSYLDVQGRTVKWLSSTTGISANTLYAIIKRDSNNISSESLEKICNALGVDIVDFLEEARGLSIKADDASAVGIIEDKYHAALNESLNDATEQLAKKIKMLYGNDSPNSITIDNLTHDEIAELQAFINYLEYKRHKID